MGTLLEFRLGADPRDARDGKQDFELSKVEIDAESFAQIRYIQRTDAGTPYTSLSLRVASMVSGWESAAERLMVTPVAPQSIDCIHRFPC